MKPPTPDWRPLLQHLQLASPAAQLRPLSANDAPQLWHVAKEPALWRFSLTRVSSLAEFEGYLATALDEQAHGRSCPLVIADAQGRLAGMTRLGNLAPEHLRLEIGWTWIGSDWQRTGLNRAVKALLLEFCFQSLGCQRVEFKANALNAASRSALAGIGATYEGCLRQHMVSHLGQWRDTVYYSILAEEWPSVRAQLNAPAAAQKPAG